MQFEQKGQAMHVWLTSDEFVELAVDRFVSNSDAFPMEGVFVASTTKDLLVPGDRGQGLMPHEPEAILDKQGLRIILSRLALPVVIPGHSVKRSDGATGLEGGVMLHANAERYRAGLEENQPPQAN